MSNQIENLSVLLIQGLAVFSITFIIRYTDGPFDAFKKLRDVVGIYDEPMYEGEVYIGVVEVVEGDKFLAKLLSCYWCVSVWMSLVCLILWKYVPEIVFLFAIIGVANLLNGIVSNNGETK